MISVEQLTKKYPARTAVDDISFEVKKGEIVGFLGPNGAGKSTTLRMITGFLPPTAGRVKVGGFDVLEQSIEARRLIGYMPEAVPLYGEMRVGEYLSFRAKLKDVPRATREKNIVRALELAAVADVRDRIIGQLSKGYKQRVGLADALVANPAILVLDEPTAGLDPNQIRQVRDLIRDLGKEHTIFLSTHILPEVEAVCGRVLIINKGKLVGEGSPATLRSELAGNRRYVLEASGAPAQLRATLEAVKGVRKVVIGSSGPDVSRDGAGAPFSRVSIEAERGYDVGVELFAAIRDAGLLLRELRMESASLEDIFAQLTTTDAESPAAEPAAETPAAEPAAETPAPAAASDGDEGKPGGSASASSEEKPS